VRPQDVVCPTGVVSALSSMKLLEAHAPPQHPSLLRMRRKPSQAALTSVLAAARISRQARTMCAFFALFSSSSLRPGTCCATLAIFA